jgi:hypothetical protein
MLKAIFNTGDYMAKVIHMWKNDYSALCGKTEFSHGMCNNHLCVRKDPSVVTCKNCLAKMGKAEKPTKSIQKKPEKEIIVHKNCKYLDATPGIVKAFGMPYCDKKDGTLKACGKCQGYKEK